MPSPQRAGGSRTRRPVLVHPASWTAPTVPTVPTVPTQPLDGPAVHQVLVDRLVGLGLRTPAAAPLQEAVR